MRTAEISAGVVYANKNGSKLFVPLTTLKLYTKPAGGYNTRTYAGGQHLIGLSFSNIGRTAHTAESLVKVAKELIKKLNFDASFLLFDDLRTEPGIHVEYWTPSQVIGTLEDVRAQREEENRQFREGEIRAKREREQTAERIANVSEVVDQIIGKKSYIMSESRSGRVTIRLEDLEALVALASQAHSK